MSAVKGVDCIWHINKFKLDTREHGISFIAESRILYDLKQFCDGDKFINHSNLNKQVYVLLPGNIPSRSIKKTSSTRIWR